MVARHEPPATGEVPTRRGGSAGDGPQTHPFISPGNVPSLANYPRCPPGYAGIDSRIDVRPGRQSRALPCPDRSHFPPTSRPSAALDTPSPAEEREAMYATVSARLARLGVGS